MSHTEEEKNRHAAWKETFEATPAPASMPTTLRRPVCNTSPVASTVNRVKVPRRRNTGRKGSSSADHDAGKVIEAAYRNTGRLARRHAGSLPASGDGTGIMADVPESPGQKTKTAVTQRIRDHVKRGWPHLGDPVVSFRGQFCYVAARLSRRSQPSPILRLRYQGSADRWGIGIYRSSSESYTESELPTSFGPKTGTPEQGIDHTFILYAGPSRHP
jgi:hypothetical protein